MFSKARRALIRQIGVAEPKISDATRTLLNASSFVLLCWLAYGFYGWLAHAGLWKAVEALFSDYRGSDWIFVFALHFIIGAIPLGAVTLGIWRLFLRSRPDIPRATLRTGPRP